MDLVYDQLSSEDLHGTTQADYLISLDANFRIEDGETVVYEEPSFPVVELARALLTWLNDPERGDFEFSSMSFEEVGSVTVRRTPSGWMFGSVFARGTSSASADWPGVQRCALDPSFTLRLQYPLIGARA
jgi:hypothetical protein